ncbi:MAG: hypothetical protein QOF48_966 [Verrucomicrobiota bacterium]|jgi:hypothetical protein
MKLFPTARKSRSNTFAVRRGMALIDCLVYMGMLALILGMAFLAFYRATEHSRDLARNAGDIAQALNAGETWRRDLRTATAAPVLANEGAASLLRLPHDAGEIAYAFRDDAIYRRALPHTNWVVLLPAVAASAMRSASRHHVTSWHWDIELKGRQKTARRRPLFGFQAAIVAERKS